MAIATANTPLVRRFCEISGQEVVVIREPIERVLSAQPGEVIRVIAGHTNSFGLYVIDLAPLFGSVSTLLGQVGPIALDVAACLTLHRFNSLTNQDLRVAGQTLDRWQRPTSQRFLDKGKHRLVVSLTDGQLELNVCDGPNAVTNQEYGWEHQTRRRLEHFARLCSPLIGKEIRFDWS